MAIKRFAGPVGIYPLISALSLFAFVIHLWTNHNGAVGKILYDPLDLDAQIRNESLGVSLIHPDRHQIVPP